MASLFGVAPKLARAVLKFMHRSGPGLCGLEPESPPGTGVLPVEWRHALWRRAFGGNPAADRFGPAGGPARQAGPKRPRDVGLLPFSPGEIGQFQSLQ